MVSRKRQCVIFYIYYRRTHGSFGNTIADRLIINFCKYHIKINSLLRSLLGL